MGTVAELRQGVTDRVRTALADATAEKLRATRAELALATQALAAAEQRLADERALRESAEAARDRAQSELVAALSRPPVVVTERVEVINPALERIEALLSAPIPELGELVFDIQRGADDRIRRVVVKED